MKTQILQLEAHDDVISTRDKLGWGQTGRVVLVWPKRARSGEQAQVLTRRLDLVMLQRHAANLGLQIALITHDAQVRTHARELHLPVFNSVEEAQRTHWRSRRRKGIPQLDEETKKKHAEILAPKINAPRAAHFGAKTLHPLVRWCLFTSAIFSLLALCAVVFPQARITLQPEIRSQQAIFDLLASPLYSSPSLSGEAPARRTEVIVEGRASLSTTGTVLVPEKTASVRVRFTNMTEDLVDVPEGLIITTMPRANQTPLRFSTVEAGQVPAGVGKFISLKARALVPGWAGNLPANSLVAIEGPLGLKLSVVNLLPAAGGTQLAAPAPAPADYVRLYDELLETLRENALGEARHSLALGDLVVTPTLRLVETLEQIYDPALPDQANTASIRRPRPAAQLGLFLRVKFEVLIVTGTDLQTLASRILDASLPAGFTPLRAPIEVAPVGLPQVAESEPLLVESVSPGKPISIRWRMRAHRLIQAQIASEQASRLARGLTVSQAADVLQTNFSLKEPPSITIIPAWWPRLPWLPIRIFVVLNQPYMEEK